MDISSSYAKILGETNFQPREFPRSGSKTTKYPRSGLKAMRGRNKERSEWKQWPATLLAATTSTILCRRFWRCASQNIEPIYWASFVQILCNTPGTAGGPGGRDRTLAIKSRKTGSIWQIGPGSMWQIGPGSIWQIGPGSMWQIGPGSMWQIKAKACWAMCGYWAGLGSHLFCVTMLL